MARRGNVRVERWVRPPGQLSMEFRDNFNWADNVRVEFRKFLGRNPKLLVNFGSDDLNWVSLYEFSIDLKAGHIARAIVLHVPAL